MKSNRESDSYCDNYGHLLLKFPPKQGEESCAQVTIYIFAKVSL